MALPASGAIRMGADIGVELGNTATSMISIGATAPRTLAGVPSGAIRVAADFYGKSSSQSFTITTNQQELNLRTYLLANGWNGASQALVTINPSVYIWSDSISTAALTITGSFPGGVQITNNGYIIGRGGNGGLSYQQNSDTSVKIGQSGGPAISLGVNATIINNSGAYIAGGGGGGGSGGYYSPFVNSWAGSGGGGAGGGTGGFTEILSIYAGGSGGAVGASGSNGSNTGPGGYEGAGGGGGRILPGTGGQGGFYGAGNEGYGRGGGAGGGGGRGSWDGKSGTPPYGVGGTGGSAGNVGENSIVDIDNVGSDFDQGGNGGGGGGWGASGGTGTQGILGPSPGATWAGGSGGKAIALNGNSATTSGSGTTYGAIS